MSYDAIKIYFGLLESNGITQGVHFETVYADWSIDWYPAATDEQKRLAAQLESQIPKSAPDVESFQAAIHTNMSLTAKARVELRKWFPLVKDAALNPPALQQGWQDLKDAEEAWLTPEVVAVIEQLAAEFHIPLLQQQ